jgi:threonine/homoserine/homoserine lactone efflux protein
MESLTIIYFFIALVTTIIGTVPFGLVNLSVADTATKTSTRKSMELASGAALVEVIFALAALLAGATLQNYLNNYNWINDN